MYIPAVEQSRITPLPIQNKKKFIGFDKETSDALGRNAAIFLHQLEYWMGTSAGDMIDGRKWVYNTYDAWSKQCGIPNSTLRAGIKKLEEMGVLLSGNFNKKRSDRTKWYSIDYDALERVISENKQASKWTAKSQQIIYKDFKKVTSEVLNRAAETFQQKVFSFSHPVQTANQNSNNHRVKKLPCIQGGGTKITATEEHHEVKTANIQNKTKTKGNQNKKTGRKDVCVSQYNTRNYLQNTNKDPQSAHRKQTRRKQPFVEQLVTDKDVELIRLEIRTRFGDELEKQIDQHIFKSTINKHLKRWFGRGQEGIQRIIEYLDAICSNAFLMGQKAMKDGRRFVLSVGSILSERLVEMFFERNGYFEVYAPKANKNTTDQQADESDGKFDVCAIEEEFQKQKDEYADTPEIVTKLDEIYTKIGPERYQSWILKARFRLEEGRVQLIAKTAFEHDHLTENNSISHALKSAGVRVVFGGYSLSETLTTTSVGYEQKPNADVLGRTQDDEGLLVLQNLRAEIVGDTSDVCGIVQELGFGDRKAFTG